MSVKKGKTYIGGITGFKALAALMVVLYHLNVPFAKGGLLGVTVFFVTSGFLIARNLLKEAEARKQIDFSRFWGRRLKRLLPAVIFMIAVTVILFAIFNRVLFTKECRDIFSVLTGWNNWHQILNKVSYFENAGGPSPLTHCWSLSIEVQFYLIISLLFLLCAPLKNRKNLLTAVFALLSLISMAMMILLFDPTADPTRVYYGTDTRIFSLLAGSLLALYEKDVRNVMKSHVLNALIGAAALAGLLAMMVMISGYSSFMFRGGQILATALSVLVIMAMLDRGSIFSRIMGMKPLKWLGNQSYAVYLWHYPMILLFTGGQKATLMQAVLALILTAVMMTLSYFFVETPISEGLITKSLRILMAKPQTAKGIARQTRVRKVFYPTIITEFLLIIAAILCIAFVPRQNALANTEELEKQAADASAITEQKIKEREEKKQEEVTQEPAEEPTEEEPAEEEPAAEPKTDEEICTSIDLMLIGDSVSLGATEQFYAVFPNSICDAAVNRYATEGAGIYEYYRSDHGWNGDGVIVALAANGGLYDSLPVMRQTIGPDTPLFLITAKAPHVEWELSNNDELRAFAEEDPNTYIIDWYWASDGHDEYFADDGTHLNPSGAEAYVECIRQAILEVYR